MEGEKRMWQQLKDQQKERGKLEMDKRRNKSTKKVIEEKDMNTQR